MSHLTTVATQLRDSSALIAALRKLGYAVELNQKIRDYYGEQVLAAIIARNVGRGYDVGFTRQADGTFRAVADFSMLGEDSAKWTQRVTQRYAVEVLRGQATRQGYRVTGEVQDKQGNIQLLLEV